MIIFTLQLERMEKLMKEDRVYRIFSAEGEGFITMEWTGYATSQQFREGTEKMLAELKTRKAGKVLGDIEQMVLIAKEDQDWLIHTFLPRALESGFKAIALIRPVHYFNKVAIETVLQNIPSHVLNVRMFDNKEDAKTWLTSLPV